MLCVICPSWQQSTQAQKQTYRQKNGIDLDRYSQTYKDIQTDRQTDMDCAVEMVDRLSLVSLLMSKHAKTMAETTNLKGVYKIEKS